MLKISNLDMSFNITNLRSQPDVPGANEFMAFTLVDFDHFMHLLKYLSLFHSIQFQDSNNFPIIIFNIDLCKILKQNTTSLFLAMHIKVSFATDGSVC